MPDPCVPIHSQAAANDSLHHQYSSCSENSGVWRKFSLAIGGGDATHGICGEVERMLGIGRAELEGPVALAYAAPAQAL